MWYAGRVGLAHQESFKFVAQLVRPPNRYLGGHGFYSRRGLRIFLCPMLMSLLNKSYAGRVSHINIVNGPAHHETLEAQLVRPPNRYLGGHGFYSRRGFKMFLCPMLMSLLNKSYAGRVSHINLVNGPAHHETLEAQLV